jgi:phosphatidylserine/phosphatidylglycerophosphate/cardiolipin synthase-like enzyme
LARKKLLQRNLAISETANEREGEWSEPISIGGASVRVFFSPEPSKSRSSIGQIIDSIQKSKKSIIFCLYLTTDKPLRDAIFDEADKGKMMFGLVNTIREPEKTTDEETVDVKPRADAVARVEIYHRSRKDKDVYSHSLFPRKSSLKGFWWERSSIPGMGKKFPVYIHHKFIVIDAETTNPIIYTGSANMSKNSLHRNDENILEIRRSRQLAEIYLSEFLRLYEHYRARSIWNQWEEGKRRDYKLEEDSSWAVDYYKPGTPKYKSRISLSTE